MSEWRKRRIEDLCVRVASGGTPSRKRPEYYNGGTIPWVKSQELVESRIVRTDERITDAGLRASSAKLLPPETVLIAMYGANVGQLAWLGTEATVNQAICALVTDPTVTDSRFLYYALAAARTDLVAHAHGAAQQNLSQQLIKPFELCVPDIADQRRIGAVLRKFDDLIGNNRRRVELLEEMARAVYNEWFVQFRYPGNESIPLVDSALGPIPHGWEAGVLDDIVRLVKDTVDPASVDPGTPAVGLEHIPRQQVTLDAWGFAGDQGSRKSVFVRGDVLFGKIRPYFHKVSVAPVDGICSTDAIVVRPAVTHWGQAVFVMSSIQLVAHATTTSNGTKMPRADWKVLGKWPVVVPPSALAIRFTEIAREQLHLAEALMFQNANLMALRDAILPKLVSGQIDLSRLNIDEFLTESAA